MSYTTPNYNHKRISRNPKIRSRKTTQKKNLSTHTRAHKEAEEGVVPGMQDPDSSSSSVFHAGETEAEEEICSKEGQSRQTDSASLNFGVSAEELPPSSSLELEAMAAAHKEV
jgi:hypothetical protein